MKLLLFSFICLIAIVHANPQWNNWNQWNQYNPFNGFQGFGQGQQGEEEQAAQVQPEVEGEQSDDPSVGTRADAPPPPPPSKIRYETHHPCKNHPHVLTQTKQKGRVTPETNYWDGKVDLSDYTYLKSIKLVIKVDNPAEIEVDPEAGEISGPSTGTIFRVTYYGTPSDTEEVKFRIIGTNGSKFPNLVSLHLNNRNICKDAKNVS